MADLEIVVNKLAMFMDSEASKGAAEGLAYEIAEALQREAQEGGEGCFENLPALKKAILDYAMEFDGSDGDED